MPPRRQTVLPSGRRVFPVIGYVGPWAMSAALVLATVGPIAPAQAEGTDFSACTTVVTPYRAVYTSTVWGIPMTGDRTLQRQDDGRFVLSHAAKTLGSRTRESSVFRLAGGDLRVDQYDMTRSILGVKKEDHARFDWSGGVIASQGLADGELPIDGQTFDALSYQLALRCDLAQGKTVLRYRVLRRSKVKVYAFELRGEEQLATALGSLKTLVVDRVTTGDARSTRIWFAPALNHMLVRLEQREKKDNLNVTLEIDELSFD